MKRLILIGLLVVVVSLFAGSVSAVCGNGVCETGEDPNLCPADCSSENVCGNNRIDRGETCDDGALGGATCQSLGYDSGTLKCKTPDAQGRGCTFDWSGCRGGGAPPNAFVGNFERPATLPADQRWITAAPQNYEIELFFWKYPVGGASSIRGRGDQVLQSCFASLMGSGECIVDFYSVVQKLEGVPENDPLVSRIKAETLTAEGIDLTGVDVADATPVTGPILMRNLKAMIIQHMPSMKKWISINLPAIQLGEYNDIKFEDLLPPNWVGITQDGVDATIKEGKITFSAQSLTGADAASFTWNYLLTGEKLLISIKVKDPAKPFHATITFDPATGMPIDWKGNKNVIIEVTAFAGYSATAENEESGEAGSFTFNTGGTLGMEFASLQFTALTATDIDVKVASLQTELTNENYARQKLTVANDYLKASALNFNADATANVKFESNKMYEAVKRSVKMADLSGPAVVVFGREGVSYIYSTELGSKAPRVYSQYLFTEVHRLLKDKTFTVRQDDELTFADTMGNIKLAVNLRGKLVEFLATPKSDPATQGQGSWDDGVVISDYGTLQVTWKRADGTTKTKTESSSSTTIGRFVDQQVEAVLKTGAKINVNANSRVITGSLLEEISPETMIEGWNYWYATTPDNYWDWGVMLESLPSGCTADKTTANTLLANGVETLSFNVDCGTQTNTPTGAVITGAAVGFKTKGKADVTTAVKDCSQRTRTGKNVCKPAKQFKGKADVEAGLGQGMPGAAVVYENGAGVFGVLLMTNFLILGMVLILIIRQRRG